MILMQRKLLVEGKFSLLGGPSVVANDQAELMLSVRFLGCSVYFNLLGVIDYDDIDEFRSKSDTWLLILLLIL